MGRYLSEDPIPTTFVCIHNNQPVGSAAILEQDMDTHPEFSPWLASVYVKPEFRNQGIGSALVRHVMEFAKQIGCPNLYLFTENQVRFYSRLGWVSIYEEVYRNADVTIMQANTNG